MSKRDEKPTPNGKKGLDPTGGSAGRAPGKGDRSRAGTTSGGGGRTHPTQGKAQSVFRQKPADRNPVIKKLINPKPRPKPKE